MKGNILLIDDSIMDLKVLTSVLERAGFACHAFTDHRKGLAWANANKAQFIFLDLQMPAVTGYDLIPVLRKLPLNADTPIVIASGKNQSDDVRRAISLGAADYIIKPVDPLVILEKLRRSEEKSQNGSEFGQVRLTDPRHQCAYLMSSIELLEVSEFGFRARLKSTVRQGETVELGGLSEEVFGSTKLVSRCLSLEPGTDGAVTALFTFVGLTESQRKVIRKMCRKIWIQSKEA